jgi:hypothetical protein
MKTFAKAKATSKRINPRDAGDLNLLRTVNNEPNRL